MKYLLLFSLKFVFFTSNTYAQTLTADQVYSKTNNAIVTIYTFDNNDNPISQGSGVVLNQKGWVVTNYHVYEGASKIVIKHANKIVAYSTILAMDAEKDILILKIADRSFPSIPIGNSALLKVGQKVYAIGSPLGLENTISEGIISGLRTNKEKTENFIQISAAISPGSSGGALVNAKGELIAITTSTIAKGQNLNFAIPVNQILAVSKLGNTPPNSNKTLTNNSVLFPIQIQNKFGFIDKTGKMVLEPQFEDAREFHDGLAGVKLAGKWGYINNAGKVDIPFEYNDSYIFQEGFAIIKVNGEYGFIDKQGKVVIEPQFYDARDFSESLAAVCVEYKHSISGNILKLYGFIDKSGKYIIEPQFLNAGSFHDGVAPVSSLSMKKGWGYVNKSGKLVIPYQFMNARDFNEGIAMVENINKDYSTAWGGIDKTGKFIIPPKFSNINGDFHNGMAYFVEDKKWGFIDRHGAIKINSIYDYASNFSEDLAAVYLNGKMGFINKMGEFVIDPIYDLAFDFQSGLSRVKINEKRGYINHQGRWVFNPDLNTNFLKTQTKIYFEQLQRFLSAKGIDDVENELRILQFSFRQTDTNSEGSQTLYYQKQNSNSQTYDFVMFTKNRSGIGFSNVRLMTYEEQQFFDLKEECSKGGSLQAQPEEIKDNCLKREYNTPRYQFQFLTCTENTGSVVYAIDLFLHR